LLLRYLSGSFFGLKSFQLSLVYLLSFLFLFELFGSDGLLSCLLDGLFFLLYLLGFKFGKFLLFSCLLLLD
jgi:hypothetical protein